MLASGYRPVGRDFPGVPASRRRARSTRSRAPSASTGSGYRGFEFFASPEVTLEEDLARRDLTINAMARGDDGTLIDPYGGAADLARRRAAPRVAGVRRGSAARAAGRALRRALRLRRRAGDRGADARRWSRRASSRRWRAERVWQELARGLMEPHPSRMLVGAARLRRAARSCCRRSTRCTASRSRSRHHPEIDTGVHVALALDWAAAHGDSTLPVRYAVLAHDLGKAATPPAAGRGTCGTSARRPAGGAAVGAPEGAAGVPRRGPARGALARRRAPGGRAAAGDAARPPRRCRRAAPAGAARHAAGRVRGRRVLASRARRPTIRRSGVLRGGARRRPRRVDAGAVARVAMARADAQGGDPRRVGRRGVRRGRLARGNAGADRIAAAVRRRAGWPRCARGAQRLRCR